MKIKADYSENFSFARMQNGNSVVRSLMLFNNSDRALRNVRVTITFDPKISEDYILVVDIVNPGEKRILDGIDIKLSSSYLSNLTEKEAGTMIISVESENEETIQKTFPISIYPYDFWEGSTKASSILPCFVLPNHPAVKTLVRQAAEKLKNLKGGCSLNEYQSEDINKVKRQLAAVYDVLCEQNILYAAPPASFEEQGQRIRMPEDIISTKLATCLDASLLYCACLEEIGINPLIILNNGHAYAGAWLVKKNFPYPIIDDSSSISKCTAKGINEILLVETTCFTSFPAKSFDESVEAANAHLLDTDSFLYCIDIKSSREAGILPMPMRILTPNGYVIEEESKIQHNDPISLPKTDEYEFGDNRNVDKHVIWERKLLDLTLRNELLNIHPRRGAMQIACPSSNAVLQKLNGGDSFELYSLPDFFENNIGPGGIYPPLISTSTSYTFSAAELNQDRLYTFTPQIEFIGRFSNIRSNAKNSIEENGANTLYLTLGALKWIDPENGADHYSPIILVPVEIVKSTLAIRATEEDISLNMTLLELLRQKFGITVSGIEDLLLKDGNISAQKIFNAFRRIIMKMEGWDVQELMFLGNFTFNKFIIWNDIHTHREMLDCNPAVASLIEGKLKVDDIEIPSEPIDVLCPASSVLQPISADSSQLRAIHDAMSGRSFVMHGPPGTGKSQTITNIIANMVYSGKRVLFVSEKRAALDVVQNRLEEIGLDPFCLELHSNKARKSAVLSKLEKTLSLVPLELPNEFTATAANIDRQRMALDKHAVSMNKLYPAGLSLYDCLSRYLSLSESIVEKRLPSTVSRNLSAEIMTNNVSAISDFTAAIRYTGVDSTCPLLDYPITDYSPDIKDKCELSLSKLLNSKGILFAVRCLRYEKELGAKFGAGLSRKSSFNVRNKMERWLAGADMMKQYAIYAKQRAVMRSLGLAFVADEYESGRINVDQLDDFYHKSLYRSYAEHILSSESDVNLFCGDIFESAIRKFRENDKSFREISRRQLKAKITNALLTSLDSPKFKEEIAVLKKAVKNTARGMSLRSLFRRLPQLMPKLCPCMLMSPLSVSQYLSSDSDQFDLVIFDEASQLPTSEAVASIARGKALIVVGDPKQLPPTSFFESNSFDEDNAEKEDLESVLDDFLAVSLPSIHLRWHYRSRHESLIAFNNARFYDNNLLTFPSCDDMNSRVIFHFVEGVYDRGRTRTNPSEADAVVEAVRKHLSCPETELDSIGIVTLNVSQKALIEKKLEEMFAKHKQLQKVDSSHKDTIFVKSLENVQGDERDVILFSVGYGVDKNGRVSMNFGPINQNGGWRRLNVATSRARKGMEVFSSLQPEQLAADYFSPKGITDLKAFLQYARDGRETIKEESSNYKLRTDAFVDKVAGELRKQGYEVVTGIGSSDFKVDIGVVDKTQPGKYLYGILFDGAGYASAEAARDREIIRPEVLQSLGWEIRRQWIMDRYNK